MVEKANLWRQRREARRRGGALLENQRVADDGWTRYSSRPSGTVVIEQPDDDAHEAD